MQGARTAQTQTSVLCRVDLHLFSVFQHCLTIVGMKLCDRTDGVGLAAPQVGVNVRLMVYNPTGERGQGEEYILVNPRIVKYGKTRDLFTEGCLSFPTTDGDPTNSPTIEAEVEVSARFLPELLMIFDLFLGEGCSC